MPPTQRETRRELILQALCDLFTTQKEGQPTGNAYTLTWDVVTRNPLEGIHDAKRYALAIHDPEEAKTPKIQQYDVVLRVILEFRAFLDREEIGSVVGNRILGDIARRVREDIYLTTADFPGGLVENVVETGNDLEVEGFADRRIRGAVFVNVQYKHAIQDPRELVSGLP